MNYKVGDPPPEGYVAWHAWAEVQHKGRLKQRQCSQCGLWNFPQEIARTEVRERTVYRTKRDAKLEVNGTTIQEECPICKKCDEKGS